MAPTQDPADFVGNPAQWNLPYFQGRVTSLDQLSLAEFSK